MTVMDCLKMMPIGQQCMVIHPVDGVVSGCVLALCSMLAESIKIQRVDMIRTQTEEHNTIVLEVSES